MSPIHYLAYGSNLHPPRLRARIPVIALSGRVELPGWTLEFNKRGSDGSAKCNLSVRAGATAYGVVYTIDEVARHTLDAIEGVGHGYTVDTLCLPEFGVCHFYRALPHAIANGLKPYDWYHALVLAGARQHGFPAAYVETISAVATLVDPDPVRRSTHAALLAT